MTAPTTTGPRGPRRALGASAFGLAAAPPLLDELPDGGGAATNRAAPAVAPTAAPLPTEPDVSSAPPARTTTAAAAQRMAPAPEGAEGAVIRLGLYLPLDLSDDLQQASTLFASQHVRELRQAGARKNSANAYAVAILQLGLQAAAASDPAELIALMPGTH